MFLAALWLAGLLAAGCWRADGAALTKEELKKYKQMVEGQGLYSPDDDVVILTATNFKSTVYGRKHATLVEFYNSWCGFCQRFAPSWKALASDIKGWRDMVVVAAIDCNDEDNSPVCRDFEILAYPTLRYIPEHYQEGPNNIGTEVQKGDSAASHRYALLMRIIQEQRDGRGAQYPNVLPYTFPDVTHLFDDVPRGTKFVFLVLEQAGSLIGPEILFDLRDISNIAIKYSFSNNSALMTKFDPQKLPSVLVLSDNKQQLLLPDGSRTRESMRMAIREFLRTKIELPDSTTEHAIVHNWLDDELPHATEVKEKEKEMRERIKAMGDVVFQADMETALRNSLKREVSLYKHITGEKLEALLKYLKVLVKYFPFGKRGHQFLIDLKDHVVAAGDELDGASVAQWIDRAEEDGLVFSGPPKWLACAGSLSKFRGYPCGLWKMFHFLTVAAAEQNVGNEGAHPREVLDAMLAYIKNFFGCNDCAKHFQLMAAENGMADVESLDSAVLWLWVAHNKVNKRLHGDATEDPEFPKVQFPLVQRCSACRNSDDTWSYPEVLRYLKHVYSSINVRYIGSDTRVLHMGLDGWSTFGNGSLPVFFKRVDASMCFILYIGSFCLIVILIRMFLKRGYKKKMYVHDLLGKV